MSAHGWSLVVVFALTACGAVEVPTERTWRLPMSDDVAGQPDGGRAVLRVQEVRLAAHISPERLMVADGARVQVHPLDLWAGPLDRMLTDFLTTTLRRTAAFADVKAPLDVGGEDLWLGVLIREFQYERRGQAARACVVADVQVRRASDATLLVARELTAEVPMVELTAGQAVAGLAAATRQVVQQVSGVCRGLGLDLVSEPAVAPPAGR